MQLLNNYIKLFRNPLFFGCYITLMVISYFFWDQPIAYYIHHLNLVNINPYLEVITRAGLGTYYLLFFVLMWILFQFLYRKPRLAHSALFLLLAVAIPGAICDVIKIIVSRARPLELFDHHLYGFQFFKTHADFWSFPSGHSIVITGVMLALSLLKPKYSWLFLIIALVVIASRILLTAHYLSDVLGSIYIASFVVGYLHQFMYAKITRMQRYTLNNEY